jgi:hypothetical protein
MSKVHLRKRQLRARYGDASDKTIERRVGQFQLPKPKYFGNRIPFWEEGELDRNDRVLAVQSDQVRNRFNRLLAEVAAAPTIDAAQAILDASGDLLDALTEAQLAGLQDAVREKPGAQSS